MYDTYTFHLMTSLYFIQAIIFAIQLLAHITWKYLTSPQFTYTTQISHYAWVVSFEMPVRIGLILLTHNLESGGIYPLWKKSLTNKEMGVSG